MPKNVWSLPAKPGGAFSLWRLQYKKSGDKWKAYSYPANAFAIMPHFRAIVFALTLFAIFPGKSAAQHPAWQNYTINDGLPSNEIYGMMQDSRGFLWFATSQGICRFDGYGFHRPVDTSMTANSSTFKISEDALGRIWFNHLDATFSIVENDTVRPWEFNNILVQKALKFKSFGSFSHEKDGTLWLPLLGLGILIVKSDGAHQVVPGTGKMALVFSEINGKMIYSYHFSNDKAEQVLQEQQNVTPELWFWEGGRGTSLGRLPIIQTKGLRIGKPLEVRRLGNGDILLCHFQTFYLIRDKHLLWHGQKDLTLNHIYSDSDGSILLACGGAKHQGLLRFRSVEHFKQDSFVNLLPGHRVISALRDHEGGWWAATSDAGVFYCKNPDLEILDVADGLPSNQVIRLVTDNAETVYAGFESADICSINRKNGRILPIPSMLSTGNVELSDLYFDPSNRRLWSGLILSFLENDAWTVAKQLLPDKKFGNPIPVKKFSAAPSGNILWASSPYGFFSIDMASGVGVKTPQDSVGSGMRTFSVTQDPDNNIWVTIPEGLRLWKNGRYELPPFTHPALRYPARMVELLPQTVGGGMVMALRGGGLLIRNQSGQFTWLTVRDGLTSDVLLDLDITPQGVIYASTNLGLNIIRLQADGIWHIETLTQKHGLPSNQVNDVVWINQELWVATDKGIACFKKMTKPAPMPMPMLEKFQVNNQAQAFSNHLELPHDQNNLSIRFFALHFRSSGDIPYRYRLIRAADTAFTYTHTREVNFANLATGRYTFEVQAQNEDGQWSEPAHWSFQVLPPWWATWWFRTLVAAALIAATYLFYRNRLQIIQQKAADREKIQDLETAALRAQMNPHFIFNCLQAIQSFIVQNDRDSATIYLARFAKLVRLALHGSVDGRHSLASEIAMLDNYLHLEQMRFKGKFEFSIRAEGLDTEEIQLPPMLVQPFVENALIHGLQNLESPGKLEIVFSLNDPQVLGVVVKDNGPGFSEKEKGITEKGAHKSVGMMLTQKRLDILTGGAGKAGMGTRNLVRETILDAKGSPAGARVRFLVPVQ